MRFAIVLLAIFSCVAISAAVFSPEESTQPTAANSPTQLSPVARGATNGYALLIGCTDYDDPQLKDLQGGQNDVELMSSLLQQRFGFHPDNIVKLTDAPTSLGSPTYQNITDQFERFAKMQFDPETFVVVYLSGHGSQQADDPKSGDERDGLDEVFCPKDVKASEVFRQMNERAITDDQIHNWLSRIADNGTHVWFVADSCHSGTVTRAGTNRVSRAPFHLPPRTNGKSERILDRVDSLPANVVSFFAAEPHQETWEADFQEIGSENSVRRYGLFTFSLYSVLAGAEGDLTYRELLQRVFDYYNDLDKDCPTPMLEGGYESRVVLGNESYEGRSRLRLIETDGKVHVTGGKIHGLTRDSVLAVYPPVDVEQATDTQIPSGYVRVTEVGPSTAQVESTSWPEGATYGAVAIQVPARCEIVHRKYEMSPIKLALDPVTATGQPLPQHLQNRWRSIIKAVPNPKNNLIESVHNIEEANWVVQLPSPSHTQAFLTRLTATQTEKQERPLTIPLGADRSPLAVEIQKNLEHVARAKNLIRVGEDSIHWADAANIEIRLVELENESDKQGSPLATGPDLQISSDQLIGLHIHNNNDFKIDFTVLYVDNKYSITPVFPGKDGAGNRIQANGSWQLTLGRIEPGKNEVEVLPGLDRLIVIGVPANAEKATTNFRWLAQSGVDRKGARSAFKDFFDYAQYGESRNTFSGSTTALDRCGMAMVCWQTEAEPKMMYASTKSSRPLLEMTTEPAEKASNPDDPASKVIMPWQIGGPMDFRRYLRFDDANYFTEQRAEATLGAYGSIMFDGRTRFEKYGTIEGLSHSMGKDKMRLSNYTVNRAGLFQLTGRSQFENVAMLSWNGKHNREEAFSVQIGAAHLDKKQVRTLLNQDEEALDYFARLMNRRGKFMRRKPQPCVILSNAMILSGKFSKDVEGSLGGKVDIIGMPHGVNLQVTHSDGQTRSYETPVVRGYRMYRVVLDDLGKVDYLEEYRPW